MHTSDLFDQFADNLESTTDELAKHNPFLLVLCDFNVKSRNW